MQSSMYCWRKLIQIQPKPPFFLPGTYFSRKRQEAEIAVEIPYDKVVAATEEETLKMMETATWKASI